MPLREDTVKNHVRGSAVLIIGRDNRHAGKVIIDLDGDGLFDSGGCAFAGELNPLAYWTQFPVGINDLLRACEFEIVNSFSVNLEHVRGGVVSGGGVDTQPFSILQQKR